MVVKSMESGRLSLLALVSSSVEWDSTSRSLIYISAVPSSFSSVTISREQIKILLLLGWHVFPLQA